MIAFYISGFFQDSRYLERNKPTGEFDTDTAQRLLEAVSPHIREAANAEVPVDQFPRQFYCTIQSKML